MYNVSMDKVAATLTKSDLKHATLTLLGFTGDGIQKCIDELQEITDNQQHVGKEMLSQQAVILNSIFMNYCTLASPKMDTPIQAKERYMRLALKAQSQCRTTLESLENMNNPKQIMQQNNATYQQVNT